MPGNDFLVAQIRAKIDTERLFGEFLDLKGTGTHRRARCIFHEDSNPSMSVNVEEGLYCCHVPDCGASGDFFDFYMRVRSLTFPEAVAELAVRVGLNPDVRAPRLPDTTPEEIAQREAEILATYEVQPPEPRPVERIIDEAIIQAFHERLLATPAFMEFLEVKRGLSRETIIKYCLGHDGVRYYIPIRNLEGQTVNLRRYKPNARASEKMLSWRTGFGEARLFPIQDFAGYAQGENDWVFLLEGEMDCLLARHLDLPALTTTGGAGTWRDAWTPMFEGRNVAICYDADDAGRAGSLLIAQHLVPVARQVRIVTIPLNEPVGADFTDYIVGHGHSLTDFWRLFGSTPPFQPDTVNRVPSAEIEPMRLHLSQASKAEYYNQSVRVNVMVSGKTTSPYLVPQDIILSCIMPGLRMCTRCPVSTAAGRLAHHLEFESNEVLECINVTDDTLTQKLKKKVGVPGKCGYVQIEVAEAMNVEEVQLIPEIERSAEDTPYVTRIGYFMGHGLRANASYVMTGTTVPEPKKQLATHLIHTAIPSQSNIDAFQLTDYVIGELKKFQPQRPGLNSLYEKFAEVYDDLEKVTRIYQRRDIMMAVDLTFLSVLSFVFQGEPLVRGWVEALIIGDSRTGKSNTVKRLMDHYGAGELASGENTTLAGLVGGLHQIGNSWALKWGRIPLNDRRLLAIDEAGDLPGDHISRMSSMRSSGIAEVIKVHTERTTARTRQIWMSNPRGERSLSTYSQGVLAVRQLVGAPADIARFDLVVAAATSDVSLDVVNATRAAEVPSTFTETLCHQRVMWAWSRKPEQVEWEADSVDQILALAMKHGYQYRHATEIPLVEPNEQRIKLARLAVATAVFFFSASDDGQRVMVKPEHVEFVASYLDGLYRKPSLAFDEYAKTQQGRHELQHTDRVAVIVRRHPGAAQLLMNQENFTQSDLQEIFGFTERKDLREATTLLRDASFLQRIGPSFYVKTPAAISWLRHEISGNMIVPQMEFATTTPTPVPIPIVVSTSDNGEEPIW